jgi:shikimate dehydrogenase
MRQFGLIGFPLSHSFSKQYFTAKFEQEGIVDCRYELYPLGSIEEIESLVVNNPPLEGLNVTIPYKKKVLRYLYDASDAVKETVACNCIVIRNKKLYGHNTDVIGFEQSLLENLQAHHNNALILGTGGAASAVAYVLRQLHIHYKFVSRNSANQDKTISYADLNQQMITDAPLIINTTPLGTFPDIETAPQIPYQHIGNKHYLFDLVYNPAKTLFLQQGEERGAVIKNGYDMLKIQAEESWKIWNAI